MQWDQQHRNNDLTEHTGTFFSNVACSKHDIPSKIFQADNMAMG
jgi:hypothetical protein